MERIINGKNANLCIAEHCQFLKRSVIFALFLDFKEKISRPWDKDRVEGREREIAIFSSFLEISPRRA